MAGVLPAFLQAIERVQAEHATLVAAELLWLTVVRTVELRGAEWQEFDLDAGLWTVPAERMKMREKHLVPLSTQALELLRSIHPLTGRGRFVFPGRKDRDKIRGAYNHAKKLDQRRDLLQQWGDVSDAWREGAKVIPFKTA